MLLFPLSLILLRLEIQNKKGSRNQLIAFSLSSSAYFFELDHGDRMLVMSLAILKFKEDVI